MADPTGAEFGDDTGRFVQHVTGSPQRAIQAEHYHHHEPRPPAKPVFPQYVGVPEHLTRTFVGRDDELARLTPGGDHVTTAVTQVTTGLGGIGKSALVATYCHRQF